MSVPRDFAQVPPPAALAADHSFGLQITMEMQKALGALTTSIEGLQKTIDRHDAKLEKIAEMSIEIRTLKETVDKQGAKLDRVRVWTERAGAIIAAAVVVAGILVKFLPSAK